MLIAIKPAIVPLINCVLFGLQVPKRGTMNTND